VITARVLNVVPTLMCGGTENQFMALTRMLDRTRFDVEFACLRRWGGFVDELVERNIPLTEYPVPTFRSVTAITQQARLARHITRRKVDIVHAYNFYGNVFATPPGRLVAPVTIASIRDRAPYLTAMQKRVQRYACQFADCILVNAAAVREWLIDEGYDAAKIAVIRNGVDLRRFDDPPAPMHLRAELGIDPEAPLVGVISRLTRLKGLEHFLEAAAIVRSRVPNVRFVIVGETSPMDRGYLSELQQYAARCGVAQDVIFTGLRRDVPAVLSSLTVSVMPSLNEALSNVVLESMAAGAPTVATRVGGTPEAIVDGVTGLLVPPANSAALADAIVHLLHERQLAAHLGHAARERIADEFSVKRMVRATEDLYIGLLERKRHKRLPSAAS
jgi:glycosyltransferase involved in cell wall biosynthesis